jgi:hypothetical protein
MARTSQAGRGRTTRCKAGGDAADLDIEAARQRAHEGVASLPVSATHGAQMTFQHASVDENRQCCLIDDRWPDTPLGPCPAGSAHGLESLVDELGRNPKPFRALFDWDEGTFFRSAKVAAFIPLFRDQFLTRPSSYGPLRSLAADTFATVTADAGRVSRLAGLGRFTHVVWGAQDPNINLNIAKSLHSELVGSTLTILRQAHHNVMLDESAAFASAILSR